MYHMYHPPMILGEDKASYWQQRADALLTEIRVYYLPQIEQLKKDLEDCNAQPDIRL